MEGGAVFLQSCCCSSDSHCFSGAAAAAKEDGSNTIEGAVFIRQEDVFTAAQIIQSEEGTPGVVNQLASVSSAGSAMATVAALSLEGKGDGQGSTVKPLTPQEREAEKVRLQGLVNAFVRNAAKGVPCTYLKEVTGERSVTRYFLDKRLEHLVVVAADDATVAEVRCPIGAIQDIYCLVEDGAGCFPAKVVGPLSPAEHELLLMVVYRSDRGGTHRFCVLAQSAKERDDFLECLRILCIYMQTLAGSNM